MSDAPERIWVNLDDNQDRCCPVESDISDTGRFFNLATATEYIRPDLAIPAAPDVQPLVEALRNLIDRYDAISTWSNLTPEHDDPQMVEAQAALSAYEKGLAK